MKEILDIFDYVYQRKECPTEIIDGIHYTLCSCGKFAILSTNSPMLMPVIHKDNIHVVFPKLSKKMQLKIFKALQSLVNTNV